MRPMSADWYDIYKRYLGSAIWQERREEAMRTHGRYCKICRRKDSLEIHHESYVLDMFVDDNNVNEHMVLCRVWQGSAGHGWAGQGMGPLWSKAGLG